jgi:hypothetical protein
VTSRGIERIAVNGFVGKAGIKSSYRQPCCWGEQPKARTSCRPHNFASAKFTVAASTCDENAQIDKPFCLYLIFSGLIL